LCSYFKADHQVNAAGTTLTKVLYNQTNFQLKLNVLTLLTIGSLSILAHVNIPNMKFLSGCIFAWELKNAAVSAEVQDFSYHLDFANDNVTTGLSDRKLVIWVACEE
jgi:hypothetical protein